MHGSNSVASSTEDKLQVILTLLQAPPFDSGGTIVYVRMRMDAERVCDHLKMRGVDAAMYHAGLSMKDRKAVQRNFTRGHKRMRVVVATVALGWESTRQTSVV
jgi:ATP-dependent DNA helicase RecQ